MRITVFTSNQPRHIGLIEALCGTGNSVLAVQECTTIFPGRVADFFRKSEVMQAYFARVIAAERTVFGGPRFMPPAARQLAIRMGDLNRLGLDALGPALDADVFIVFGASYIQGDLCDFLVERGALNMHMGVSPYYRGSSTNFWALHDERPEFVGATIHLLSKGLDSGPILYHALPAAEAVDPFELGMRAVQAAHRSLVERLANDTLRALEPVMQDRAQELRYTRNSNFTDAVAREYLDRLPTSGRIEAELANRDLSLFVRPDIAQPAAVSGLATV